MLMLIMMMWWTFSLISLFFICFKFYTVLYTLSCIHTFTEYGWLILNEIHVLVNKCTIREIEIQINFLCNENLQWQPALLQQLDKWLTWLGWKQMVIYSTIYMQWAMHIEADYYDGEQWKQYAVYILYARRILI